MTIRILIVISLVVLTLSCEAPNSPDSLLNSIQQDVQYAKAQFVKVNITTDGKGLVSPDGIATGKVGIPISITATPLTDYTFKKWRILKGAESVKIANPISANTTITVSKDGVEIIAEFSDKPEVLYITPSGTNIDKNTWIFVYFTTEIDKTSVTSENIRLEKQSGATVNSNIVIESNYAVLKPEQNLIDWSTYVVRVDSTIKDKLGRNLKSNESQSFTTSNLTDTTGPSSASFSISNLTDGLYITKNGKISVSNMNAVKATGVSSLDIGLYSDSSFSATLVDTLNSLAYDPSSTREIDFSTNPAGLYFFGGQFKSTTGYPSSLNANTIYSVFYDKLAPVLASVNLPGTLVGGDLYVSSPSVNLTISATDNYHLTANDQTTYSKVYQTLLSNSTSLPNGTIPLTFNASQPWTLASGADGIRNVSIAVTDLAGNVSNQVLKTVYLDTTPPTASVSVLGNLLATSSSSVPLSLSASDVLSGKNTLDLRFIKDSPDITNYTSSTVFTTSPIVNLSAGEGVKNIKLLVVDPMGNQKTVSTSIFYDLTAPLAPTFLINGGASTALNQSLKLSSIYSSDNDLVESMSISQDNSNWEPWETYTANRDLTASTVGNRTIYIRTRDRAGNISSTGSASININGIAPAANVTINNGAFYTNNQIVDINLSSISNNAKTAWFSNTNGNWGTGILINGLTTYTKTGFDMGAGNGVKTVYVKIADASNNVLGIITDTITLDTAAPTGTLTLNSGLTTSVSLKANYTLSITDVLSGISQYQLIENGVAQSWINWSTSPSGVAQIKNGLTSVNFTAPYSGTKTVQVNVKDNAGNITSTPLSATITLATPTMTYATKGKYTNKVDVFASALTNQGASYPTLVRVLSLANSTQNPNFDLTGATIYPWQGIVDGNPISVPNLSVTPGSIMYFWIQAYDDDTGGSGPWVGLTPGGTDKGAVGFATTVTLVYKASTENTLKNSIIGVLQNGTGITPSIGIFSPITITAIDENLISSTYNADANKIYGSPIIVTPGAGLDPTQIKNIAAGGCKLFVMGGSFGVFTEVNTNFATWGLSGASPAQLIGTKSSSGGQNFSNMLALSTTAEAGISTKFTNSYYLPLATSDIYDGAVAPYNPSIGKSIQVYTTAINRVISLYFLPSTTINDDANDLVFYARVKLNKSYGYAIIRQGNYLAYSFPEIPDQGTFPKIQFYNLVCEMRDRP